MLYRSVIIRIGLQFTACWLVLGCLSPVADERNAELFVTVFDSNIDPVEDQEVILYNFGLQTNITDENGVCIFHNLEPILSSIKVNSTNNFPFLEHVLLKPGRNDYNVYLNPIATFKVGFEDGTLPFNWESFGDAEWFISDFDAHTGNYCVRSGYLEPGETSTLRTAISIYTDQTDFLFWYRLETDTDQQFFKFTIDDDEVFRVSGVTDWQPYQGLLSSGQHTLTWTLGERSSGDSQGTVWLDDFYIFYE